MTTEKTDKETPIKWFPRTLSKQEKKNHKLVARYKHRIGILGPKPRKRDDSQNMSAIRIEQYKGQLNKEKIQEERSKKNAHLKKEKLNKKPKEKIEKVATPEEVKKANSLIRVHWKKGIHVVVNESLSRLFNPDGAIKDNAVIPGTIDKTQPMIGDKGVVIRVRNQTFITVDFSLSDLKYDKDKKIWNEVKKKDEDQQKDIWDIHFSALSPDPDAY